MNTYLVVSGVLTAVLAIAHSIVGELRILIPLEKVADLPAVGGSVRQTRRTLRFAWHVTSVFGLGFAAILLRYAQFGEFDTEQVRLLRILSATFAASFLVAIVGSRGKHPAWIVFLIVAGLTWASTS